MDLISQLDTFLDTGLRSAAFFNGRLLSAEDLTQLETAARQFDRRLGRALGDGVAFGLTVGRAGPDLAGQSAVVVDPGLAVNRAGRALVLAGRTAVRLVPPAADPPPPPAAFRSCCGDEAARPRFDDDPFGDCVAAAGDPPPAIGLGLLVLAPAEIGEGLAPVGGLGNVVPACNAKTRADGVRFRLIPLPALTPDPGAALARGTVAHLCLGTRELADLPPVAAPTAYGLLDRLRADGRLTDHDVPLAVVDRRADGVRFIDVWAVRRRLTAPAAGAGGSLAAADRRRAEAEATWLQFQDHLAALPGDAALKAADHFPYLPPAGLLAKGIGWKTFLGAHAPPAAAGLDRGLVRDVLRRSFDRSPVSVWVSDPAWDPDERTRPGPEPFDVFTLGDGTTLFARSAAGRVRVFFTDKTTGGKEVTAVVRLKPVLVSTTWQNEGTTADVVDVPGVAAGGGEVAFDAASFPKAPTYPINVVAGGTTDVLADLGAAAKTTLTVQLVEFLTETPITTSAARVTAVGADGKEYTATHLARRVLPIDRVRRAGTPTVPRRPVRRGVRPRRLPPAEPALHEPVVLRRPAARGLHGHDAGARLSDRVPGRRPAGRGGGQDGRVPAPPGAGGRRPAGPGAAAADRHPRRPAGAPPARPARPGRRGAVGRDDPLVDLDPIRDWAEAVRGRLQADYPGYGIEAAAPAVFLAANPADPADTPRGFAVFGDVGVPLAVVPDEQRMSRPVAVTPDRFPGLSADAADRLKAAGMATVTDLAGSWTGRVAEAAGVSADVARSLLADAAGLSREVRRDPLSGYEGMTADVKAKLTAAGIKTEVDLANADPAALARAVPGGVAVRLVDQARRAVPTAGWSVAGLGLTPAAVSKLSAAGLHTLQDVVDAAAAPEARGRLAAALADAGDAGLVDRVRGKALGAMIGAAAAAAPPPSLEADVGLSREEVGRLRAAGVFTAADLAARDPAALAAAATLDPARAAAVVATAKEKDRIALAGVLPARGVTAGELAAAGVTHVGALLDPAAGAAVAPIFGGANVGAAVLTGAAGLGRISVLRRMG